MIARLDSVIAGAAGSYRADTRFLAVLRIAYAAWIILLPVDILWMTDVPDDFLRARPGPFFFLSDVPPVEVLVAISVMRVVLAVLLALGAFTVPVSILLSACMIVASGLSYSFSKVDHFILFELVPVFLAFAGWGATWSFDAVRRGRHGVGAEVSRGLPILLFALTLGWAMLSAAVPKLMGGWLDPARHATRGYVARDIAVGEKLGPLGPFMLAVDVDPIWKALDYATIVAEGALILLVLAPLVFRAWLLLLSTFHIGVYLALGISFLDYVLVYAVFFSPLVMWVAQLIRRPADDLHRGDDPPGARAATTSYATVPPVST